jgi:hypothetical protein
VASESQPGPPCRRLFFPNVNPQQCSCDRFLHVSRTYPSNGACAALVALPQILLPEGKPRYLRDCGITTLPLAQLNAVLEPLGYVIRGSKTRSAERFVRCTDTHGGVERYGLFELKRLEEHDSDGAGD